MSRGLIRNTWFHCLQLSQGLLKNTHLQMLKPSLEQWSVAWQVSHQHPPSPPNVTVRNMQEHDMTHIEATPIWCAAYDKYKCDHISGLQNPSLPTFYSGNWAGNPENIRWLVSHESNSGQPFLIQIPVLPNTACIYVLINLVSTVMMLQYFESDHLTTYQWFKPLIYFQAHQATIDVDRILFTGG